MVEVPDATMKISLPKAASPNGSARSCSPVAYWLTPSMWLSSADGGLLATRNSRRCLAAGKSLAWKSLRAEKSFALPVSASDSDSSASRAACTGASERVAMSLIRLKAGSVVASASARQSSASSSFSCSLRSGRPG